LLFILALLIAFLRAEEPPGYDILIKNGRVIDGSLSAPVGSDVAIRGDRIVRIGKHIPGTAKIVVEADGLVVAPGFIDLHTHTEGGLYFPETRSCLNFLTQGVTTVVAGQCGQSGWPLFERAADAMKRLEEQGIGPNVAMLVGHGYVRRLVLGGDDRDPTPDEMERMRSLVQEAMEDGAWGLTTGLVYLPGMYAKTQEILELVKAIVPYGGIYHSHIRDEREKLLEAVREALQISQKSGAPVHISHLKVMGKPNWGLVQKACALIEEARAKGLRVTADQYPYRYSMLEPYVSPVPPQAWLGGENYDGLKDADVERILGCLRDEELIELYQKTAPQPGPEEAQLRFLRGLPRRTLLSFVAEAFPVLETMSGPQNPRQRQLFLERMENPEEARRIKEEIRKFVDLLAGPENYQVAICVDKTLEGKSLAEAAVLRGKSVEDTAIEPQLMGAKCVPYQMREEDIEYVLSKDYVATGSDAAVPFYGIGFPHIRHYATFLHKIKGYALERKIVSLPFVIRSQTSLPAEIMNWKDRGWIKEGYAADVVVLDPANIRTPASLTSPHQYSEGVKYLIINGKLAIDRGRWNGSLPGRVLRRKKQA
jgi:N-acyl-D-aspartate/D-glutamate deacylase